VGRDPVPAVLPCAVVGGAMTVAEIGCLKRAQYMLEVAARFVKENDLGEYVANWDETECDGYCLVDDCTIEASELGNLIARLEAANAVRPR
jgi:hypothetical protein